ncbi:MAG: M48 family metallopeptidase [Pyrinomonadaceae bacterium]
MNDRNFGKRIVVGVLAATLWILPVVAIAQTQIKMPKNKYPVQTDVTEGNKAAVQIERQFPIMNDADAASYIERVGQNLVDQIPSQFRHQGFDYRFKWVNARDLNAFALPGGPMYINRGMLEAANNEGELAGVMAHELSHVALRHATAQATKQGSAKNTLGTIGLILGGAILGGEAGAQLGMLGAQAWMTKYSREYETQSDILGARMMAGAGYDPRDLANVFRTIQQQGGSGAPEFLSSHPNPGNRYEKINREAQYLQVSRNPIKLTRDFSRTKERFRAMPRARSMAEIQQGYRSEQGQGGSSSPIITGRYSESVQFPSSRTRSYSNLEWLRINVPSNWLDFPAQDSVTFAPQGAYGEQGITRGLMLGTYTGRNRNLSLDTQEYVNALLQDNNYLRQSGAVSRVYIDGRQANLTSLAGTSPITRRTEIVNIYTTQLRNGALFYAITVVPDSESSNYSSTFRNVLSSIQLND